MFPIFFTFHLNVLLLQTKNLEKGNNLIRTKYIGNMLKKFSRSSRCQFVTDTKYTNPSFSSSSDTKFLLL